MSRVLAEFLRQTGKHVTNGNLLPVDDGDDRTDLEGHRHGVIGTMRLDFIAIGVEQLDLRAQAPLPPLPPRRIDDNQRRKAGHVVNLLGDSHPLRRSRTDGTGIFTDDGTGMRIPGGQLGAGLDRLAVVATCSVAP